MPFVRQKKLKNMKLAHRELRKELRKLRAKAVVDEHCWQWFTELINASNNARGATPEQEAALRRARSGARKFWIAMRT